jgi:hypothetical protein
MESFVARMIKQNADVSLEQGQEKYRAYFINTSIYSKYKTGVDEKLVEDGYGNVIVTA